MLHVQIQEKESLLYVAVKFYLIVSCLSLRINKPLKVVQGAYIDLF